MQIKSLNFKIMNYLIWAKIIILKVKPTKKNLNLGVRKNHLNFKHVKI
jgi:hypothetical protein